MVGCIIKEEQTQVQIVQNPRLLFYVSVAHRMLRYINL